MAAARAARASRRRDRRRDEVRDDLAAPLPDPASTDRRAAAQGSALLRPELPAGGRLVSREFRPCGPGQPEEPRQQPLLPVPPGGARAGPRADSVGTADRTDARSRAARVFALLASA